MRPKWARDGDHPGPPINRPDDSRTNFQPRPERLGWAAITFSIGEPISFGHDLQVPIVSPLPSFVIEGAGAPRNGSPALISDSTVVRGAAQARQIYFHYSNIARGNRPDRHVLHSRNGQGRVVFESAVLLPTNSSCPWDKYDPQSRVGRSPRRFAGL